ncbi:hypothetical protein MBRA_00956 [Methylobacterium brachiatum]|nr:hypothetical protein MBRA_00956 [Methylobacterium brachiatum]
MRFSVVGYGSGSTDGTGVAKQYRTLRGEVNLSQTKYALSDGAGLGLSLRGQTRKRSDQSDNNDVALELTDASLTEITQLANYLCCLVGKRREMYGSLVKEDRKREFPLYKEDEIANEREAVLAALDLLIDNAGTVRKLCSRDLSVAVDARGRRIP